MIRNKIKFLFLICFVANSVTLHADDAGVQGDALKELEQALSKVEDDLNNSATKGGLLKRAQFTHRVEQYEPLDDIDTITREAGKMYFFTELLNLKDRTVKHRWEYKGKVMAEVVIQVTSPQFRVHSSKNIPADALGQWSVVVTDESGQVLTRTNITVTE